MPFKLIQGTFHAVGFQPDGDSIHCKPKNVVIVSRESA